MSQELIRLVANDHRAFNEELYVVYNKSVASSKPGDGASLVRMRCEIQSLNYSLKEGESQKLVPFGMRTVIDAIVDQKENKIEFLVNEADAALPEELRGGGMGSYVLSEMIRWGQHLSSELTVEPILISAPQNAGSGRESRLKAFFSQLGFSIENKNGKGVYATAPSVGDLKAHVNTQKIQKVNLISWSNEWLDSTVKLANQLREESQALSFYKEQAGNQRDDKAGAQPFWAGLLLGLVGGFVVGLLIAL